LGGEWVDGPGGGHALAQLAVQNEGVWMRLVLRVHDRYVMPCHAAITSRREPKAIVYPRLEVRQKLLLLATLPEAARPGNTYCLFGRRKQGQHVQATHLSPLLQS
jgi:hypothetical protein